MTALITVDDWFGYVFATVLAVGLAIIAVLFIAALLGFFDKK